MTYYQNLGMLFYAIAAADKVVKKQEYNALCEIVKNEWKDTDHTKDTFGSDAVSQMLIVFEWFDYEAMDANECFTDFKEFYEEHTSWFTDQRKRMIYNTAQIIADAFAGSNKSELIMLSRIALLFKLPAEELSA